MKINWDMEITTLDGEPIKDSIENNKKNLTIRSAVVHALFFPHTDDKSDGKRKFERACLAMRIHEEANPVLKSEEITQCKEFCSKIYGPLIIHRVWVALDEGVALSVVKDEPASKA